MEPLRLAILGQGRSGRDIHGVHLRTRPEQFRIAAVVDPLPDRRARAEAEYGCKSYGHYTELFGRTDLDLVVNATPSYLHVPITTDLLDHGFNVLCEKPFARKTSEVDGMIRASERSGKLLAIFQQSRFAPYFVKAKEVADSGILGRIVQVSVAFSGFARRWDWQCIQANNGGNLLNTGPHPLDQALRFLDFPGMPSVQCKMDRTNTFGDAEDYVKLIMTAPDRPLIDLEISSCNAYPCFTYHIQGTLGGLKGSTTHLDWKYFVPSEAPPQKLIRTPLMQADGTPAYCGETLAWHDDHWDVPETQLDLFDAITRAYYDMLYRTLTESAPLVVTHQQVRQQIAVIEECHRQNPLSRTEEAMNL
jgi:scyllo-inositol 2-dehydrogenase (NADP+)